VGQIDHNRGMFQLQTQQGTFTVTLPYNPGNATTDYFNRLRTGDNIRMEGTVTGQGRIELYRFI
jgi:tRNA(Ile2) C34 agmatinyltransferase TiaS